MNQPPQVSLTTQAAPSVQVSQPPPPAPQPQAPQQPAQPVIEPKQLDLTPEPTQQQQQFQLDVKSHLQQQQLLQQQQQQQQQLGQQSPPVAPKKPRRPKSKKNDQKKSKMVTGYIIYASEIRKEIIQKHQDKNFGEISKIVGDEWKRLSQENKVAYEKRAQEQNSLFKMEFAAVAAEAALELSKLADVAAAQAAREEKQQEEQQHHQQQHQLQLNDCSTSSTGTGACGFNEEPFINQQQHLPEHEQASFGASIDLTTNPYGASNNQAHSYSNYQQQQSTASYYPQMMNQSMPMLIRQGTFNGASSAVDALLQSQQQQQPLSQQQQQQLSQQQQQQLSQQQQQSFQIIQQHQQQQPISTMVQYCNNPACCCPNSARYQPYPYPYSPPAQPTTPTTLQQQSVSPQTSPTHQQYPYKRNNIIYRKPIIIKLRPKDASTQTDPINWVEKIEKDSSAGEKKPLRFSQKFIDHMICATNSPTKTRNDTDTNDSNNNDNSDPIDDAETL